MSVCVCCGVRGVCAKGGVKKKKSSGKSEVVALFRESLNRRVRERQTVWSVVRSWWCGVGRRARWDR